VIVVFETTFPIPFFVLAPSTAVVATTGRERRLLVDCVRGSTNYACLGPTDRP
jgi:hypothetical protein